MGLSEATPLSYDAAWDLVLTQNMAVELLNMSNMTTTPEPWTREIRGCTGFAVSSPAGNFLAHNTDSQSGSGDNIVVLMYWEPNNGDYAYMTMDPPGWADVGFGLNEMGIAITTNAGNPNTAASTGMYTGFMERYVMEHAATLDEAVGYFAKHLQDGKSFGTSGALIHIMDFNDGSMAKLQVRSSVLEVTYGEESPSGVTYIGSANHFTGDFNPDETYYYESSDERYKRLMELLPQVETFDLEACWSVLSDTNGGDEANNNTISRVGDRSGTTFGHIFTEGGISYAMGPPHAYLEQYGQPQHVAYADISNMNLKTFTAMPTCWKITLNWELESEENITGCNLLRTNSQTGTYTQINTSPIKERTYTDTGLKNRKSYYYKLETISTDGTSRTDGIVTATPRLKYLFKR
ncbi:MAG: hypothetical protein GY868_11445 [Deltaproteobacteria bacterium]|nr:hypothetical protein [Deltaproteobacteria bacterium]